MKITGIETIALRDSGGGDAVGWNIDAESGGYDLTVVRVHTDEGISGIGQCEAPSLVVEAIIRNSMGLEQTLVGEDPTEVQRLWQKMYVRTGLYGRRGVTITAIGAVETALWDIAGKAAGRPIHELIWMSFTVAGMAAEAKTRVRPYATVYPPGDSISEMRDRIALAIERGLSAVKIEEWQGQFGNVSVAKDVEVIEAARDALGPDRELMIDVQNKWQDVGRAMSSIRAIEQFAPYFIEAPLPADSVDGYARLADSMDTRIAVGDWGFTGRHEFRDLLVRGRVDVVQPSSVRAGGMHEILNIAEMAYGYGALCIPHAWCHVVGVAAEIQLAAIVPNMPYFELPIAFPDSPIISELLDPAFEIAQDGTVAVPNRPGLGFELNEDVVSRYRVDPY
jgi:L-alanine-DL-glutamate epimerase-like enolase superfamily enzyme